MHSANDRNRPSNSEQLIGALLSGHIEAARRMPTGVWTDECGPSPRGLLSGSFNPRHAGHVALRRAAEAWLGIPVGYELAIVNADKPSLSRTEICRRCEQFDDAPVLVTRSAAFVDKARFLEATVFVVGADTALRVLDERYYADAGGLPTALGRLRDHGCRFLVACRHFGGRLVTADDLPLPQEHADLFELLPAEQFRRDVSSTDLRSDAGDR